MTQYRVSGSALIYMLEKTGKTEIIPLSEIEKIQVLKDDQEKGNGGDDGRDPEMP